jgi:hypothetical protein
MLTALHNFTKPHVIAYPKTAVFIFTTARMRTSALTLNGLAEIK